MTLNKNESGRLIKKRLGHKIALEGYKNIFCYSYSTGVRVCRAVAPINEFDQNTLENVYIKDKLVQWFPFLEKIYSEKIGTIFKFQDLPFAVLDYDEMSFIESKERLEKSEFLSKFPHSMSPSISGRLHLEIWMDFSKIVRDAYVLSKDGSKDAWKEGERYKIYKDIIERIAIKIEEETGLKTDLKNIGKHIAWNPSEFSEINSYWKDKNPIPVKYFQEMLCPKPLEKGLEKFLGELQYFALFSEESYLHVIEYCKEHLGIEVKKEHERYYFKAVRLIRNNFSSISRHISEQWNSELFDLLKGKTEKIGIGLEICHKQIFGVDRDDLKVYLRRILLYILSLRIEKKYVHKKYVYKYIVSEVENKKWFSERFLEENWRNRKSAISRGVVSVQKIVPMLGNGRTFDAIKYLAPLLTTRHGKEEACVIFQSALHLSNANDKGSRMKDFRGLCKKVERRPCLGHSRKVA